MSRSPNADGSRLWEHVREVLKAHLEPWPHQTQNGSDTRSQAALARALGLSPQALSNFLSGKRTNRSLGGLAMAKACSLGIEFVCDQHRIGRLGVATNDCMPSARPQLEFVFTDDFQIVHDSCPLTVRFKKGPEAAAESTAQPTIRVKITS